MKFTLVFVLLATTAMAQYQYPATRKVEHTDDYHGTKIADPYRWLEDDRSAETMAWVKAQNEVTFGYLNKIGFKGKIFDDLKKAYNYPKYSKLSE